MTFDLDDLVSLSESDESTETEDEDTRRLRKVSIEACVSSPLLAIHNVTWSL
jgi:hypothetical protein